MNVSDIKTLYRYNSWANGLILTAIASLPHEDIGRNLGGSLPTLRSVHRGQITLMFRQLGSAPPPTDLILFKSENR